MEKIISIATVLFQLFIAFVGLLIIYMVFALLDMTEINFPNAVGFIIFQPLWGILICGLTIIACIILGLPIRLNPKLNKWWSKRPIIIFIGVMIGLLLLLLSLNSHLMQTAKFTIDGKEQTKLIPNSVLVVTGWFLTAFCLLHFYPLAAIKWLIKKIWPGRKVKL